MPSILGKRTRGSNEPQVSASLRTRSKRQVQPKIFFDEQPPAAATLSRPKRKFGPLEDVENVGLVSTKEPLVSEKRRPGRPPKKQKLTAAAAAATPPDQVKAEDDQDSKENCDVNLSSPAKKEENIVFSSPAAVPKTPRHRDALSKKAPITPKHRVSLSGKPLTPHTPRTPSTPLALVPTIYNTARQLFVRSTHAQRLIGRENERRQISRFIQSNAEAGKGAAMYISGPPGTGKSALVDEICQSIETANTRQAYINCMSMKTSRDIFSKLAEVFELEGDGSAVSKSLLNVFTGLSQSYVVVLDEIDHLLSLDLEALYTVFEWTARPNSRLVLIGIANALDLTDRFLPRLKASGLRPTLLPFVPYTAPQISTVITTRLKTLNDPMEIDFVPFVHPAAIQFCSKKVANQTGDLRTAFDLCRKAIDVIETETKNKFAKHAEGQTSLPTPTKSPLGEKLNGASSAPVTPKKGAIDNAMKELAMLTPSTAPRATIAHLAKISSNTFGHGSAQRLLGLNLQQKAALCALVALERKKKMATAVLSNTPSKSARAAPTVRALFESYTILCKKERLLQPLTSVEFRDVVSSLETLSLINILDGTRSSSFNIFSTPSKKMKNVMSTNNVDDKQIGIGFTEKELEAAIEGAGSGLLKAIIGGNGL